MKSTTYRAVLKKDKYLSISPITFCLLVLQFFWLIIASCLHKSFLYLHVENVIRMNVSFWTWNQSLICCCLPTVPAYYFKPYHSNMTPDGVRREVTPAISWRTSSSLTFHEGELMSISRKIMIDIKQRRYKCTARCSHNNVTKHTVSPVHHRTHN